MAQTIGRVDFLARLDGRSIPAEARKLGKQIGDAGDEAGKTFGDRMDSSFQKRLSEFGDDLSQDLKLDARRAGETFGDTLDSTLQGRFRRMQSNLADILTDEKSFAEFAKGFDNVGQAVDRATDDLAELRHEKTMLRDETGREIETNVLSEEQFRRATRAIRELGDATQVQVDREAKLTASQRQVARETEELNAKWNRLTRLVGDTEAFEQAASRMGGTEEAHRRLRMEIEQGGSALGRTRTEIEGYVDRLDLTRDRSLKASDAAERLAASVAEADRRHNSFATTLTKVSKVISKPWQNLDNDVRLVVGLIAAAADQMAALGSAAGAGLISVGGTIGALGVGLSGVIPVFLALNREVEDLPPRMRDVAREFQGLKTGFKETAAIISSSAFRQMPDTFSSLEASLRVLDPAFGTLGITVGKLGDDFAKGLAPGSKGLEELNTFIGDSTPLFDSLARSAGKMGGALIKAFNGANPLTQDFVGWIEKLTDRFDTFAGSTAFDTWVRNSQLIWGDFGELLDATGEALGDLANPASVANLRGFMDDLTEFMPKLATGLNVVGELNLLGLVAGALNDVGSALAPLAGPLYDLAGALYEVADVAINEITQGLGAIAGAIAPLVQGGADFLDSLPPEAIEAIADAVVILGGAFLLLKGYGAIGGALTAMGMFTTVGGAMSATAEGMTGKLKSLAGKAGIFGLVATGAFIAAGAIQDVNRKMQGLEGAGADAVASGASLQDTFGKVGFAFDTTSGVVEMFSSAMRNATGTTGGFVSSSDDVLNRLGDFGNFFTFISAGFDTTGQDALALSNTLKELDEPLANLAGTDLSAATQQFSGYAREVGASKDQVLIMLNEMPAFREQLVLAAQAEDGLATDADLVALALGGATTSARDAGDVLAELEGRSVLTGEAIDGLADKIRNFGNATLTTRDAERQFEESLDAAAAALTENGNSLDITDEKGRTNQKTLDDIAKSALDFAGATYEQTGSIDGATSAIQRGRDALVEQLIQFGKTEEEANSYADELGLIPGNVQTIIDTPGLGSAVDGARRMNDAVRRVPTRWNTEFTTSGKSQGDIFPRTAIGGSFSGAQTRIIAEDGPEAVVPLDRDLNQVHPSVRMLSAFAQGLLPNLGVGGNDKPAKQINFHAGSIVVQGADDPYAAALEVVDAISELI